MSRQSVEVGEDELWCSELSERRGETGENGMEGNGRLDSEGSSLFGAVEPEVL